ncbi:MAG: hypothetical protein QF492_05640 [Candidatus Krumholzibacteria bacterium]|jgi:hypothetical protein|nr:hypothetical protein [Candidatus Krumholzibacteria bacterium]MDP6669368.1 hypothetical protein [Candidatus Krumholzibacteria bacterium]MDP6796739.1 hypothetical protein [Candidatus Krumholzibacteria bacterium]MDP7022360.1 hypothetical protein [Candidatus Krumholzibacteria bacterium]
MIREKPVRLKLRGEEMDGRISYYSPYLMKKRREAELPGSKGQVLLELKNFDISSLLMIGEKVLAEGSGFDHYASLRALQDQLSLDEGCILACGNCQYFLFSGMARDMSNGSRGYCLHGKLGKNLRPGDICEIFYNCHHFSYGPGEEREEFRLKWKKSLVARNRKQVARGEKTLPERPFPMDLPEDLDPPRPPEP